MNSFGTIGFIGGGSITRALVLGFLDAGFAIENICVADPSREVRERLSETCVIKTVEDNLKLVNCSDIIILAVIPQIAADVLTQISKENWTNKVIISLLAGVSTGTIESHFTTPSRVVRAMPSTLAEIREAVTGICAGSVATSNDMQLAKNLFSLIGTVQVVNESQMNAVTGLSGTGPVYIATVVEALAEGGILVGLPAHIAYAMAAQTVKSAAQLLIKTGEHPAVMRDGVCTPGGTGISAVHVLEKGGLRSTLIDAISLAVKRSVELDKSVK